MLKQLFFGAILMILFFGFVIFQLVSSLVPAFTNYVAGLPIAIIAFMLLFSPLLIGVLAVAFIWRREED